MGGTWRAWTIFGLPPPMCAAILALTVDARRASGVDFPPRPDKREFICDQAQLIPPDIKEPLRKRLEKLRTDKATSIIVVTIPSPAQYRAGGMSIEQYARLLYDAWGIGHAKIPVRGRGGGRKRTVEWHKGILLLVPVGDRKARIELGGGFRARQGRSAPAGSFRGTTWAGSFSPCFPDLPSAP